MIANKKTVWYILEFYGGMDYIIRYTMQVIECLDFLF